MLYEAFQLGANTILVPMVESAFAIEYFANRGRPLTTSANKLLRDCGSSFRLSHPNNVEWGEQVNLQHLMSHSALNMHYVNGVPLNAEENMLPIKDFLNGNKKYDYPAIEVLSNQGQYFIIVVVAS